MNWMSFVTPFAKPLGGIINKGLAMAAASFVTWAVAKGWPADSVTPIVATVVGAISTAITGFALTQGIQIPIINDDTTNGVKVVSSGSSSPAVNSPQ